MMKSPRTLRHRRVWGLRGLVAFTLSRDDYRARHRNAKDGASVWKKRYPLAWPSRPGTASGISTVLLDSGSHANDTWGSTGMAQVDTPSLGVRHAFSLHSLSAVFHDSF